MVSLTIPVSDELKAELRHFSWVNWSDTVREDFIKQDELAEMLKRWESKEEQEFTEWTVQLGRKAKEESWKELVASLSPEEKRILFK